MKVVAAALLVLGLVSVASVFSEFQAVKALSLFLCGDSSATALANENVVNNQTSSPTTTFSSVIDNQVSQADEDKSGSHQPSGIRLVMIGDSITRYQYLSLAYYLRHGHWFDPKEKPHLVNQNSFMRKAPKGKGWPRFYNATNQMLAPLEKCDCFRARWPNINAVDGNVMENRYFHDPSRNNSLAYIQAFGNSNSVLHGRLLPEDAFRNISQWKFKHVNSTWKWSYKDWGEALEKLVAPMNATHVQLNAGLWPNDFSTNKPARDSIVKAIDKTGLVGIWRTNTYLTSRELRESSVETDASMVPLFRDKVLNVSWTQKVDTRFYWDDKHFLEPVYRVMNEELLEMVGHQFPLEYQKQSLSSILTDSTITQ
jgi:hypothetical protein